MNPDDRLRDSIARLDNPDRPKERQAMTHADRSEHLPPEISEFLAYIEEMWEGCEPGRGCTGCEVKLKIANLRAAWARRESMTSRDVPYELITGGAELRHNFPQTPASDATCPPDATETPADTRAGVETAEGRTEAHSDVTEQWQRDLEAILDPGRVWKHGVLVTARREIEDLRAEVDEITGSGLAWVERAEAAERALAERETDAGGMDNQGAELERLRARVARVEALATECERRAKGADRKRRRSAQRWAAEAISIRAALADPEVGA